MFDSLRSRSVARAATVVTMLAALALATGAPATARAEDKKPASAASSGPASAAVAVLPAAPADFTVTSADKKATFSLKDAKGKYVAVHFLLETECPVCLKHTRDTVLKSPKMPDVVNIFLKPDSAKAILKWESKLGPIGDAAAEAAKGKADELLGKAGGAKEAADKIAAKAQIYRDPDAKLADAFGIPGGYKFHGETMHYPALVLLDPTGKEVFRYVGKNNNDRYSADKLINKVEELKGAGSEKMGDDMKAEGKAMKEDAKKAKDDAKNRLKGMKDAWNNPAPAAATPVEPAK